MRPTDCCPPSRSSLALLALAMLACGGNSDDATDGDTDLAAACDNRIASLAPTDDAANVYFRDTVRVELAEADPGWSVVVLDPDGEPVAGTFETDSDTVKELSLQLEASTTYTIRTDYCRGKVETSFTTSEVGEPIDSTKLNGRVYQVDLSAGEVLYPPDVGDAAIGLISDFVVLVRIDRDPDGTLSFLGAVGDDSTGVVVQDSCTRTLDLPSNVVFRNPEFRLEAETLPFAYETVTFDIEDLVLAGAIAPDLSYVAGIELEGTLDTRPLDSVFGSGTEGAVCDLLDPLGVACEDCGSGEEFCVTIRLKGAIAEQSAAGVTAVTADDVAANPFCGGE